MSPSPTLIPKKYLQCISQDGFLFVSGRQKEIIVTAGGENIAPVPIEDAIKVERRRHFKMNEIFFNYEIFFKEVLKDYVANCLVIGK